MLLPDRSKRFACSASVSLSSSRSSLSAKRSVLVVSVFGVYALNRRVAHSYMIDGSSWASHTCRGAWHRWPEMPGTPFSAWQVTRYYPRRLAHVATIRYGVVSGSTWSYPREVKVVVHIPRFLLHTGIRTVEHYHHLLHPLDKFPCRRRLRNAVIFCVLAGF